MSTRSVIASLFFINAALATASDANTQPLPADLDRFYQDVNFIACFSTSAERTQAALFSEKQQATQSERLKRLATAVRNVSDLTARIDPKINALPGLAAADQEQNMLQILSCDGGSDSITVTVRVIYLEPAIRTWLVQNFDQFEQGDLKAQFTDRMNQLFKQKSRVESHVWKMVGGQWKRKEASHVLLKLVK